MLFLITQKRIAKNKERDFEEKINDLIDQCNNGKFCSNKKGKNDTEAIHYVNDGEEYDRLFLKKK